MLEIYGAKPADLGLIDLSPREMMSWLYCPIKARRREPCVIPDNLMQFRPIVDEVRMALSSDRWFDSYIYITAKTLWVNPENPGNRPGWHSDGFMTDDLNFIWSDTNGTLFWEPEKRVSFTQNHLASLREMHEAAEPDVANHNTYQNKHLLLLDQRVIHRVADIKRAGMRSFVKISVSKSRYNLVGNSINHGLGLDWEYVERSDGRNDPAGAK